MKPLEMYAEHFCKKIVTSNEYFNNGVHGNPNLLFPTLKAKADEVCSEVDNLFIFETYRSNERQKDLHSKGWSKIEQYGMHYYGIAVDLVFKDDGKWTWDGDYKTVREKYKEKGLIVLGSWDMAHAQMVTVSQQSNLRNTVRKTVMDYQAQCGLRADGDAGIKTQQAFRKLFNEPAIAIDGIDIKNPNSNKAIC